MDVVTWYSIPEWHHCCCWLSVYLAPGAAAVAVVTSAATTVQENESPSEPAKEKWIPPAAVWRPYATILISGQVVARLLRGKIHWRNLRNQVLPCAYRLQRQSRKVCGYHALIYGFLGAQISAVGPRTIGVVLLTSCFVGMVFTIQFVREFARLGLTRSVGGVLALAFARELSPVICAVILAGRVGSAFAAELGTMQVINFTARMQIKTSTLIRVPCGWQVSEQTDSMRVLRTDPVDYLVTPRALACLICQPILTVFGFCVVCGPRNDYLKVFKTFETI